MSNIEVKDVVCDYGVYEDDKLIYIFNDRENANLVKDILDVDLKHKRYNRELLHTKNSSFEIRLFNHENSKVLYDNLTEYQLKRIAEILNEDWKNINEKN